MADGTVMYISYEVQRRVQECSGLLRAKGLGPLETQVLMVLARHCDKQTLECRVSNDTLAWEVFVNEKSIRRALIALIDIGAVRAIGKTWRGVTRHKIILTAEMAAYWVAREQSDNTARRAMGTKDLGDIAQDLDWEEMELSLAGVWSNQDQQEWDAQVDAENHSGHLVPACSENHSGHLVPACSENHSGHLVPTQWTSSPNMVDI
jgi:hypothetical protein